MLFALLLGLQFAIAIPMAIISWGGHHPAVGFPDNDPTDDSGGCSGRILWPSRIGTIVSSVLVIVLFVRLAYAAKFGRWICRLDGEGPREKGAPGSQGGLANETTAV